MVQVLMFLFAGILLLSNIVMYTVYSIQFDRESNRQQSAFTEMMVHLITMEDEDTAITYIEHYYHINGIEIAFFDSNNVLIFQTSDRLNTVEPIELLSDSNQIIGYIYYDNQNSLFGSELTLGLVMMNILSIMIFFIFLKLSKNYLDSWANLLQEDFSLVGKYDDGFHFVDLHEVSQRLIESKNVENRVKEYQKEYVKMLAHDIKTPLTVMKAYLEGIKLKRIEMDDETIDELTAEIHEIESMIPKFMTDNVQSLRTKQNIGEITRSTLNRLSEVFHSKHLTIKQQIDDYQMSISYQDIIRIVEHLLFNAYYYNKDDGLIEVILDSKEHRLTVKDTGIGMSEETMSHIEKGQFRADEAIKHNLMGTGLGLQIVKEIIDRLHLEMKITSKLEVGTTITIDLEPE